MMSSGGEDFSFLRLQHPFRLIATGASSTGKTQFFNYILKNQNLCIGGLTGGSKRIDRLVICYAVADPAYADWYQTAPLCIYHKGLPSPEELENESLIRKDQNNLVILDDLDDRENECETIHRLFTIFSHHYSCSILYSTHSLFMKNKRSVLISRNCNYLVLFKNVRDKSAVGILARQTHPGQSKFLVDAFKQATEGEGGGRWLLCDFDTNCPERYRYRQTLCWPSETIVFYEPKEEEKDEAREKK